MLRLGRDRLLTCAGNRFKITIIIRLDLQFLILQKCRQKLLLKKSERSMADAGGLIVYVKK